MKNVLLLGLLDKQHIILSLLYTFNKIAKVNLVTDNKSLLGLTEDFQGLVSEGTAPYNLPTTDISIYVVDYISDIDEEEMEQADITIWDTTLDIIPNPDVIVITDNFEAYDIMLDNNAIPAVPTFVPNSYKGINSDIYTKVNIPLSVSAGKDIQTIFATKELRPIKASGIPALTAKIGNLITEYSVTELTKQATKPVPIPKKKGGNK